MASWYGFEPTSRPRVASPDWIVSSIRWRVLWERSIRIVDSGLVSAGGRLKSMFSAAARLHLTVIRQASGK